MSPTEIKSATDAMVAATEGEIAQNAQNVESRQATLAPGLATGSNTPGGYNYQRTIAPIVDPIASGMVTNARQAMLRQALTDATFQANLAKETAQRDYNARYRAYQEEQAKRTRERQRRADQQAAQVAQAQIAALQNSQSPSAVSTLNIANTGTAPVAARVATNPTNLAANVGTRVIVPAANSVSVLGYTPMNTRQLTGNIGSSYLMNNAGGSYLLGR